MRYERFMRSLDQVKARYEAEIRKILRDMAQEDATIEQALLKKPAPPMGVSAASQAWTPARRAKQARLMRQKMRAKYGKAKG